MKRQALMTPRFSVLRATRTHMVVGAEASAVVDAGATAAAAYRARVQTFVVKLSIKIKIAFQKVA